MGLAGGYAYYEFNGRKTLIIPYPYSFNENAKNALRSELKEAQSANILIIGDRMGERLSNYTPEMIKRLSINFKNPPTIYNWSKPHEGLHRTLFKLKSLSKVPRIVIYHGASSELYEKTFSVNDKKAILKNFSLYDNDKIISLIITFPFLSKFIYKKTDYFELGAIKEYQSHVSSAQKFDEKEISFKLFDYEMREMNDFLKTKKSHLILITTPINLEIRPKEVCSHSTSNDIIELQQIIDNSIKEGNYKDAFTKAQSLTNETYGNALSSFLLGKSALGLGDLKLARESLQKAAIFDCTVWRGNAVYNSIMKSLALNHQLQLIDFDQLMASSLSKEGLFQDELFPQTLFYQTMFQDLEDILKKLLSIGE